MFGYRINQAPVFSADGSNGRILVQNPAFNDYLMVLEIAGEDGGVLYRSGYIAPNQYIEEISLPAPPPSGKYEATAYLNAVDPDTLTYVDALECPLSITIK